MISSHSKKKDTKKTIFGSEAKSKSISNIKSYTDVWTKEVRVDDQDQENIQCNVKCPYINKIISIALGRKIRESCKFDAHLLNTYYHFFLLITLIIDKRTDTLRFRVALLLINIPSSNRLNCASSSPTFL